MSFWDSLRDRLETIGADIGNWVPKIIGALIILIVGLFIARILRRITRRILENDAVEAVLDKAGIGSALKNAGYSAANLGASVVYGFLGLVVVLLAATALEVQAIIDLLERLIAFVLTKAGADVTVAENGRIGADRALHAADEGSQFDVILMDMQMPVMDGYTATGLLRERGYTGSIIALTAHAMDGDRDRAIEAGCDDYDTKPVDLDRLLEKIQAHSI